MSFSSGRRGALRGVELTKRGAYAAPGIFIVSHLAEERNVRPL
jgi:hypothetical protein